MGAWHFAFRLLFVSCWTFFLPVSNQKRCFDVGNPSRSIENKKLIIDMSSIINQIWTSFWCNFMFSSKFNQCCMALPLWKTIWQSHLAKPYGKSSLKSDATQGGGPGSHIWQGHSAKHTASLYTRCISRKPFSQLNNQRMMNIWKKHIFTCRLCMVRTVHEQCTKIVRIFYIR